MGAQLPVAAYSLWLFCCSRFPFRATGWRRGVQVLKHGSTEAVSALFTLTGQVYHRDAFVFSLPGVVIEIADECSGIRSSIGLLLTSLLAGHVFLRNAWTKSILFLAVLPVRS